MSKAETRQAATTKEHARLTNDIKDLRLEQDHLVSKITDYKAQRQAAHARLRRVNAEVEQLQAQKSDLSDSISSLRSERSAMRVRTWWKLRLGVLS